MIKFEINGKPFNAQNIQEEILNAAMQSVEKQMRDLIGSIRHPETGEFPTIFVSGDSIENLRFHIEGSSELLALVNERLSPEERKFVNVTTSNTEKAVPRAFLSYAWEDSELAAKLAESLQCNGIETWWAGWCMSSGDSIRQKIDEGLKECTYFIVLLTPASIEKPWVNQEMDAGFVRKINAESKFIPVRYRLSVDQLPPLLQGILSPEFKDLEKDIAQLINDIHGITKKPPLGKAPAIAVEGNKLKSEYSPAALAIAKIFVIESCSAIKFDPQISLDELIQKTGLSKEDIDDAIYELNSFLKLHHGYVSPENELFVKFDSNWMEWNPFNDALRLATDMINNENFPSTPREIAQKYNWEPRRLNPAMFYLVNRKLVRALEAMGDTSYSIIDIAKIDATRRFVKSRS